RGPPSRVGAARGGGGRGGRAPGVGELGPRRVRVAAPAELERLLELVLGLGFGFRPCCTFREIGARLGRPSSRGVGGDLVRGFSRLVLLERIVVLKRTGREAFLPATAQQDRAPPGRPARGPRRPPGPLRPGRAGP